MVPKQAGMDDRPLIGDMLMDEVRLLTFRRPSQGLQENAGAYLAFGLVCAWLAGLGRYWDNPRAALWQHLGLGSVAYVFVLAALLWALLAPLRPSRWTYRNVLLFVTLTSPPAFLYAIPVEHFMSAAAARATNSWFLALVAAWRVALLYVFLKRFARLSGNALLVALLLPLTIIVIALAVLNLEHATFDFMGGLRTDDGTSNDGAYAFVSLLSMLCILLAPLLIVGYLNCIYHAWWQARENARSREP